MGSQEYTIVNFNSEIAPSVYESQNAYEKVKCRHVQPIHEVSVLIKQLVKRSIHVKFRRRGTEEHDDGGEQEEHG
jgi:uncharacterized membrane protein YfhO